MTPKIGQILNRTVLVSIPALFSDGACRPCTLLGFEMHGLWLQSDDLNERLLADEMHDLMTQAPVVFVPFAHIAGVLIPTAPPVRLPPGAQQPPTAGPPPPTVDKPPARQARRQGGRRAPGQATGQGKGRSSKP